MQGCDMRRHQQASNLVPYMQLLTVNEKRVLCHVINHWGKNEDVHPGVLPFISRATALVRLAAVISPLKGGEPGQRLFRQIVGKLTAEDTRPYGGSSFVRWSMRLDDLKVYRRFGPHPERGKPLPFLGKEKVTVGMKFSLPKRGYVPDKDVLVSPCVTLKRQSQGLWQVEVLARCQHTVEEWLITNCQ